MRRATPTPRGWRALIALTLLLLAVSPAAFHHSLTHRSSVVLTSARSPIDEVSSIIRAQEARAASDRAAAERSALADRAAAEARRRLLEARNAAARSYSPRRPLIAVTSVSAALACIRQKESGGDYNARGRFRGAYQYMISTWSDWGAKDPVSGEFHRWHDPADAPPWAQDQRAAEDFARGPRQIHQNWPFTSRECGY